MKLLTALETALARRLPARTVLLLPGEAFFVAAVPNPEKTAGPALDELVELALEGLSPFPLDQLLYGAVADARAGHLLIYAAARDRLRQFEAGDLAPRLHVFPSFVAALALPPPEAGGVRLHATPTTISALFYESGQPLPARVVSRPLPPAPPEDPPPLADRARDGARALAPELGLRGDAVQPILYLLHPDDDPNPGLPPRFRHEPLAWRSESLPESVRPATQALAWKDPELWRADLREPRFRRAAAAERTAAARLDWAAKAGLAALLLLFLGQLGLWGTQLYQAWLGGLVASRQSGVDAIAAKENLVLRLEQFALASESPVEQLDRINEVRPGPVHFTRVLGGHAAQGLYVEGRARSSSIFNLYLDNLRQLDGVESVSVERQQVSSERGTEFAVRLAFRPPEAAPEEPPPAAEPAADAPPEEPAAPVAEVAPAADETPPAADDGAPPRPGRRKPEPPAEVSPAPAPAEVNPLAPPRPKPRAQP